MKYIKSLLAILAFISLTSALSACNTMEGAGKDIEAGGRKIKDTAEKHKAN